MLSRTLNTASSARDSSDTVSSCTDTPKLFPSSMRGIASWIEIFTVPISSIKSSRCVFSSASGATTALLHDSADVDRGTQATSPSILRLLAFDPLLSASSGSGRTSMPAATAPGGALNSGASFSRRCRTMTLAGRTAWMISLASRENPSMISRYCRRHSSGDASACTAAPSSFPDGRSLLAIALLTKRAGPRTARPRPAPTTNNNVHVGFFARLQRRQYYNLYLWERTHHPRPPHRPRPAPAAPG